MNIEEIDYLEIAQIPCGSIQFVSHFTILCKPDTKIPVHFRMYLASDKEKSGVLEFPVEVPIELIYSAQHQELLQEFYDGAPFVAISCYRLKVYKKTTSTGVEFFGYAEDFEVVRDAHEKIEEEIWR
jgi:hypothetical protein